MMKPGTARVAMTVMTVTVVIGGVVVVNSFFRGSFVVGLVLIVLPLFLVTSVLPRVLPVKFGRGAGNDPGSRQPCTSPKSLPHSSEGRLLVRWWTGFHIGA